MQFHETGLPQDPTVYKAFMMFTKNQALPQPRRSFGGNMRDAEGTNDIPLRIAQILNDAGANKPETLSLALLRLLPQQVHGVVEKSFGHGMIESINELSKHSRTAFAYIDEASDNVKLLSLATAMATFEQFQRESEKAQEQIGKMAGGEKPEGGLMIPVVPDVRLFEMLSQATFDKTSSPSLETAFREKLSDFRYANDRLRAAIIESGIIEQMPPEFAMRIQMQEQAASKRTPSFDETQLLDNAEVRKAFAVLAAHPLASADSIEAAIEVGTILTKTLDGANPTGVAAGLLLTGLREIGPGDGEFLAKKLSWDVMELLENYGGDKDMHPMQLRTAPPEFKQFLLANTVAMMNRMKEGVGQVKDMIAQQPDIPEKDRDMVVAANLGEMQHMLDHMAQTLFMTGPTGAPKLEDLFKATTKEVRDAIREAMPSVPKALPPGMGFRKPPEPPKGGQNFDLD